MAVWSKVGFLSRGQTIACLCEYEKPPCVNDALPMAVLIGANTSHTSLTDHVGTGRIRTDCGVSCMIRDASSTVVLPKPVNDGTSLQLMVGGGGRGCDHSKSLNDAAEVGSPIEQVFDSGADGAVR